jgi:hypothetical protein
VIWKIFLLPADAQDASRIIQGCQPIDGVLPNLVLPHLPKFNRQSAFSIEIETFPNEDEGRYTDSKIAIAERLRDTPMFDLALLHEIGHVVDQYGGIEKTNCLRVIKATETYKMLARLLPEDEEAYLGHTAFVPVLQKDGSVTNGPVDGGFVEYLLREDELFARAFAQYIVYSTENQELIRLIRGLITPQPEIPFLPVHWLESDFEPVHQALTDLFTQMGWR